MRRYQEDDGANLNRAGHAHDENRRDFRSIWMSIFSKRKFDSKNSILDRILCVSVDILL
jgi:hypothetical protein